MPRSAGVTNANGAACAGPPDRGSVITRPPPNTPAGRNSHAPTAAITIAAMTSPPRQPHAVAIPTIATGASA